MCLLVFCIDGKVPQEQVAKPIGQWMRHILQPRVLLDCARLGGLSQFSAITFHCRQSEISVALAEQNFVSQTSGCDDMHASRHSINHSVMQENGGIHQTASDGQHKGAWSEHLIQKRGSSLTPSKVPCFLKGINAIWQPVVVDEQIIVAHSLLVFHGSHPESLKVLKMSSVSPVVLCLCNLIYILENCREIGVRSSEKDG